MKELKAIRDLAQKWPHESDVKVGPNDECQPVGWCAEHKGRYAIQCKRCELEDLLPALEAAVTKEIEWRQKTVRPFLKWWMQQEFRNTYPTSIMGACEAAFNAGRAEIADLKRQLAERENDCPQIFDNRAELDAYVQEKVDPLLHALDAAYQDLGADPQTPREAGFWLFGLILGLVTGWVWKPVARPKEKP